ncbi:collagen alpha-1(III) chain-like [Procambarus clarkii]|uniref:collagen alpha-1(III) chain-like n=1 Tax=Procambarus clarkii TaxID=6728 RepID=UPI0037422B12
MPRGSTTRRVPHSRPGRRAGTWPRVVARATLVRTGRPDPWGQPRETGRPATGNTRGKTGKSQKHALPARHVTPRQGMGPKAGPARGPPTPGHLSPPPRTCAPGVGPKLATSRRRRRHMSLDKEKTWPLGPAQGTRRAGSGEPRRKGRKDADARPNDQTRGRWRRGMGPKAEHKGRRALHAWPRGDAGKGTPGRRRGPGQGARLGTPRCGAPWTRTGAAGWCPT